MPPPLTDWVSCPGGVGGLIPTVVESTDSSGNVTGYQVLYVESFGEIQGKGSGRQLPCARKTTTSGIKDL